jgi:hypothetical protein
MYKPRGEPKLLDCVCRRVLKQLGNPMLAGLIERSSPRMVVKMLRLDSLPDQAPGGQDQRKIVASDIEIVGQILTR